MRNLEAKESESSGAPERQSRRRALASRLSSMTNSKKINVFLTLSIFIGAVFRLVLIGSTPAPFIDEILAAIDFHSTLTTGLHYTGYRVDFLGKITPIIDGRAITHFLVGDSIGDFRLASAVLGILTIYVIYRICSELFNETTGQWAAVAIAVMPWAIYYSRVNIPASEYVFATSTCVLFVILAIRDTSFSMYVLASFSAALTIYVYPSAIVSTPLLVSVTLFVLTRKPLTFPWRGTCVMAFTAGIFLLPYYWDHLFARGASATTSLNQVISGRLLWNQNLPLTEQVRLFLKNWSSFLSPRYLFISGDPDPRQSVQIIGEVGWIIAILGAIGIITCIRRRSRSDYLILTWLLVYPIADALTYQNANANSVVGATGEIPWACLAAVGATSVISIARTKYKTWVGASIVIAFTVQSIFFGLVYFCNYNAKFGSAFEPPREYAQAIYAIEKSDLQHVPITDHSGYLRNLVFDYYSNYKLNVTSWYSSCFRLPLNVSKYTVSPRIFVVSETTSYQGYADCIPARSLISTDTKQLRAAGWHLRILADYPNSPMSTYRTRIIFATRPPGVVRDTDSR